MSRTTARTWFETEARFRQVCGDAQSMATGEASETFAAQMVEASKAAGLDTPRHASIAEAAGVAVPARGHRATAEARMILERLELRRELFGEKKGQVLGRVRFSNDTGAVELNLDAEKCRQILLICATQIVDTAKQVSRDMTADCVDGYAMLAREGGA